MIRRVAEGWSTNVDEIDAEGRRLFGKRYFAVRYEDLLREPWVCVRRLWSFLGAEKIQSSLSAKVAREMRSNPDEAWQASRGDRLAAILDKGKAGPVFPRRTFRRL